MPDLVGTSDTVQAQSSALLFPTSEIISNYRAELQAIIAATQYLS